MSAAIVAALGVLTAALVALGVAPVAPTARFAGSLGVAALIALASPMLAASVATALITAFAVDAWAARGRPRVERASPGVVTRGRTFPLRFDADAPGRLEIRQPAPPDVEIGEITSARPFETTLTARRRGRHTLPPVATKVTGPLGLAAHFRSVGGEATIRAYPDVPTARDLAIRVRRGRFRDVGRRALGPLGLGTDFESIRDYLPDDDVRQINWRASQRTGRPMSNVFRIEQNREVVCVVDAGRLMGAPLGNGTRLDVAADAAVAVALVADALGDRCGLVAFDAEIRRRSSPARAGGDALVQALFDLEPADVDADYELAFRTIASGKRAFVLVLTDLLDEAAAASLLEAVPVLARRHAVAIASARDQEIDELVSTPPSGPEDVYTASAAAHVLDARSLVVARLRRLGADVIEAPAAQLGRACVGAYLRAKQRARL